ncbi:MAG: division/cell wall cluster transcriptional repressor MraZ [Paracoccaceae bacterium]
MKFFTGSSTHKVDAKGRVSLPASYRKVLEGVGSTHVVVLPQMQHPDYHVALSQAGHEKIVEQFEQLKLEGDDRAALARHIVTDARQIPFDDTGRMVLSQDLREQIGLAGEVRFAGQGSYFQLWEPGKCAAYEASLEDRGRKLVPLIRLEGLHG